MNKMRYQGSSQKLISCLFNTRVQGAAFLILECKEKNKLGKSGELHEIVHTEQPNLNLDSLISQLVLGPKSVATLENTFALPK